MPLPEALIALATLGTAHSPAELPPAPASVTGLLEQVDGPPEAQILLLAGSLALQEKTGYLPLRPEAPLPRPGGPDERPVVSPAAAQHLLQMLGGEHKEVLPEWLAAAHDRGLRPPEELLPYLLDRGLKKVELRPLLFPLLGPRAVWLAEQAGIGPWAYFQLDGVETVWEEAETAVRVALLAHLRWRDPARGRALLASTWRNEGARQREQFLRELDEGLGPADEPFLEAALDDRSGPVRLAAAYRLACLPGSAFVQRMTARATSLLALQRSWRGTRLAVDEGGAATGDSWVRDGLNVEPPASNRISPARLLLQQLLAFVPPADWQQTWKLKPTELLDVALRAPEELVFVNGIAWASYRAGDSDFARLLLREALPRLSQALLAQLLPAMPAPAVNAILLPGLQRREAFTPTHPAFAALLAHSQPWSRELAAAVLTAVSSTLHPANIHPSPEMKALLQHLALHAPPEDSRALLAGLQAQNRPELQKGWRKAADEMQVTLGYRRRMLQAFEL